LSLPEVICPYQIYHTITNLENAPQHTKFTLLSATQLIDYFLAPSFAAVVISDDFESDLDIGLTIMCDNSNFGDLSNTNLRQEATGQAF
jgi:hypothetical protein